MSSTVKCATALRAAASLGGGETVHQNTLTLESILRFLECYPGRLFLKDEQARYIYCSMECGASGTRAPIGKTELEAQENPATGRKYYEEDQRLLREGGSMKAVEEIATEGGSLYFEVKQAAVTDESGAVIGIIGTIDDVTREHRLQEELHRQYTTDVLTGVRNGMFLEEWLRDCRPEYPFTLIAADCNYLKLINDTYGHECGDQLLRHVGDLLRENLPETCIPVRTGGDEFLILCNGMGADEAQRLVELLKEKAQHKQVQDTVLSVAFGSCTAENESMPFVACLRKADASMYAEKARMKKAHEEDEHDTPSST